jgi:predicted small metal-binding protein
MAVVCPCGCKIEGEDDPERSKNFRQHLIDDHGQEKETLNMLEVREELGDDTIKELLSMELSLRAHLAPAHRTYEEILADSVKGNGVVCVSEIPLTRHQLENYTNSITCPVCARKIGGDDDGELSKNLKDHCDGHEALKAAMQARILPSSP